MYPGFITAKKTKQNKTQSLNCTYILFLFSSLSQNIAYFITLAHGLNDLMREFSSEWDYSARLMARSHPNFCIKQSSFKKSIIHACIFKLILSFVLQPFEVNSPLLKDEEFLSYISEGYDKHMLPKFE